MYICKELFGLSADWPIGRTYKRADQWAEMVQIRLCKLIVLPPPHKSVLPAPVPKMFYLKLEIEI